MQDVTPQFSIPIGEEAKLRTLAIELAKDILEPEDILKTLDMTWDDYEQIKNTRAFRELYTQAVTEWRSAANTQKRVKLLAATTVEASLPTFWKDFNNGQESLNARVGLLTILAKIGGLGQPEPVDRVAMPGQNFKLEIHLSGDQKETITISAPTIDSQAYTPSETEEDNSQDQEEFDPFK